MLKKAMSLFLLIFLLSPLAGCWNQKETKDLAIVLGTGVDWVAEGRLRLTVQLAKAPGFAASGTGGTAQEAASWVVSAEGKTILDAEGSLGKMLSREIFWDNCVTLVLGEEMARKGTGLVTNFFQRNRGPRETMWMIVAEGEAKNFLESYSNMEKTSAGALESLARMKEGYSVQLWQFAEMLASKGVQPLMTWVEVKEMGVTPEPAQERILPTHKQLNITGAGVFKEDRLIGRLDNYETTGLLWLKGEPVKGAIIVSDPAEPDKDISIIVRRGSRKIIPEYDGQSVRFTVKVKAEGDMIEQQSREDIVKPEKIKDLEKKMAEEIKKQTAVVLRKAQSEYGLDIFGFGDYFHQKYNRAWRELQDQWDSKFAEAEVNVEVEAYIRETGLLSRRAGVHAE